jgi:hypothetical protein
MAAVTSPGAQDAVLQEQQPSRFKRAAAFHFGAAGSPIASIEALLIVPASDALWQGARAGWQTGGALEVRKRATVWLLS